MTKSLDTRNVVNELVQFLNELGEAQLDETTYYYNATEAILKASDAIQQIESGEEE